eukprot:CAMPEP_0182524316 /NCGR_PEP_ID=MMETSP1323-20130603/1705_1 /TAXON_ID=236787 /ORGANISM="Florenciella parvula, Strain RCC1693" /LENGTH=81 /DNA_ID=CAMNT_0024732857 /DNA_START=325 /DNA_END=571 /DNA_ORIENTATION=-
MTMMMMMMMIQMIMLYFDDDSSRSDGGVMVMAAVRADVLKLLKLLAPLLLVAVAVVDSATHIPVSNATDAALGDTAAARGE